jgi:excisionase family DNA binding protein
MPEKTTAATVERLTYTPEEAFIALGIGRTLGYRKIREGVIPALKMDGRWIVPKAALERMLDEWSSFAESLSHGGSNLAFAASTAGTKVPR